MEEGRMGDMWSETERTPVENNRQQIGSKEENKSRAQPRKGENSMRRFNFRVPRPVTSRHFSTAAAPAPVTVTPGLNTG